MDTSWIPNDSTSIFLALAAILATILYYYFKTKDLPPGPTGLPYFGYWPFMNDKTCHLQLEKYKKKYGDITSFTCTGRLYINMCSAKAIREVHVGKGDCFGDRNMEFNLLSQFFADSFAFTNGESWKVLKKFFLQILKQRGMLAINESLSGSLYDAIDSTINELKSKEGQPIDIVELLTDKCTKMMRLAVFGDVGITDEQIRLFSGDYESVLPQMTPRRRLASGTFARYVLLPLTFGYRDYNKKLKKMQDRLHDIINQHKATYNKDIIRDTIDEFIQERDSRYSQGDPTAQHFTDEALMSTLIQFCDSGRSVTMFIGMFIKTLLDHPEEQDKIYQELLEVVGLDRRPTIEDKNKLTYTNAFFLEALRTSNLFPFFPSQECTKETTVRGYRIPKGALTLMNIWSCHHDPHVYEEPDKFIPSRFIHTEGKRKTDPPVTFGIGRRACIGESFAMTQCLMFLSSLIKTFHLKLPNDAANEAKLLPSKKLRILVVSRN